MKSFREIAEGMMKLSDNKMDDIIKNKYEGFVTTYKFNKEGSIELGKLMDDVMISKDNKFMHINSRQSPAMMKKTQAIVKKFNLKKID